MDIVLKDGNIEEYKDSKHILNFIRPNEIKKLNFLDICKYADFNGWDSYIQEGLVFETRGLIQFRHALYILLNKKIFIEKFKQNPDFIPDIQQTSLKKSKIDQNEAISLQEILIGLNIKKFLKEIRFTNNLMFLGVLMYLIGSELENKNKKITIFLCTEFRNLYPDEIESIKEIDEIYLNNKILTWSHLSIFEEMIKSNNEKGKLRKRRRFY